MDVITGRDKEDAEMSDKRNGMLMKVALWALVMMMGINAYAIPIHMAEGPATVDAVAVTDAKMLSEENEDAGVEEAEAQRITLQDFHLLGTSDYGLLIFAEGGFYSLQEEAIPDVISQLGEVKIDSLPDISDLEPIKRGSKGDNVKEIQQVLVDMGYLSVNPDGKFGGKSQTAVSEFQKAIGLKETGTTDELMQMLLLSARETPVDIVVDFDPAMRYPELAGHTAANLSAIAEYGLALEYDDIEGIGVMRNGAEAEVDATEGPDIDSRMFELELMLRVSQKGGQAVIDPIVQIRCECVRRPVMQALVLKAGNERCTIPLTDLQTELSGAKSIETATGRLDTDALRVLVAAEEADELKFRIKCKYSEYDGEFGDVAAAAIIGKAGQAL